MEKEHIYNLISRYFENECTSDEIATIMEWCDKSEENKREFVRLKKIWIVADKQSDGVISSLLSDNWSRIQENISSKRSKMYTKRTLIYYTSISAAMALILMFGMALFMNERLQNHQIEYTDFYMPQGEKGQLFLPDGTKVWLNSGSKLTLGSDFNAQNRHVMLDGEACFDVAKKDKHRFIVQTSSLDIKVYGTVFNVSAYSDSEETNVFLKRGSVGVYRKDSDEELAVLTPNQHISVNNGSFLTRIDSFDDDADIAWTFEELIFNFSPLEDVFSKMENWYGVNISIISPPSRKDLKYRFKIKSESLTEILVLINKITPIEYEIDGKEVRIRYK